MILTLMILLPLIGGLVVALLPGKMPRLLRYATGALLVMEATLAVFVLPELGFLDSAEGAVETLRLAEDYVWSEALGLRYTVAVDAISSWLILLVSLAFPLVFLSLRSIDASRVKATMCCMLLLECTLVGAFCAQDVILFYGFFEMSLVPVLFLTGIWGGSSRIEAAKRFFVYTALGSLAFLVAILVLAGEASRDSVDFSYVALARVQLPFELQLVLFVCLMLAFAIKAPLFPFHSWQAELYKEAPAPFSALFAGLVSKLGVYGMLRIAMPMFPLASTFLAPTVALLAVLAVFHGSLCAWVQRDFKRLLAYSSMAHLGVVVLGIFSVTRSGIAGAGIQMLAHGVTTVGLFLLVAFLEERFGTTDLRDIQGLASVSPRFSTLLITLAMASVGLPGLCGFVGEFMILSGVIGSSTLSPWTVSFTLAAAFGAFLSALYMMRAIRLLCWGQEKVLEPATPAGALKSSGDSKTVSTPLDMQGGALWGTCALGAAALTLGLFPCFVSDSMSQSAEVLVGDFRSRFAVDMERLHASAVGQEQNGILLLLDETAKPGGAFAAFWGEGGGQ